MYLSARARQRRQLVSHAFGGHISLKEARLSKSPAYEGIRIREDTGYMIISWAVYGVSLNHNSSYTFNLELSREDIARLFAESMSNLPLEKVVQLLSDSRPEPKTQEVATEDHEVGAQASPAT